MNTYDDRQTGHMPNTFVIGVILGAVMAALFTPWTGQSTRRKMRGKMQTLREKMKDEAENAGNTLQNVAERSEEMLDNANSSSGRSRSSQDPL